MVKLKISDVKGGYTLVIELNGNESETFFFKDKVEMESFVRGFYVAKRNIGLAVLSIK